MTDPGEQSHIPDGDALSGARPERPKSARVPVRRGPRARSAVPPPTAAGAALEAREDGLSLPRRSAGSTASVDQLQDDDGRGRPPDARQFVGTGIGVDARPSTDAASNGTLGDSVEGGSHRRAATRGTGVVAPPEWAAAATSEDKLALRAAVRHNVRDRVRHYMHRPAFADDVYHGEGDVSILFRKAVQRTFECSPSQATWVLAQRLPSKTGRWKNNTSTPALTPTTAQPPPEGNDGTTSPSPTRASANGTNGEANASAEPPPDARVRNNDLVRGICYRARSNLHHAIGRATTRAWMAGATFDTVVNSGGNEEDAQPPQPLTSNAAKAEWWLNGRRYLMTVRGRKGFIEAFRVFKSIVSKRRDAEDETDADNDNATSADEGDGNVLPAWRAQVAWVSAKVRLDHHPSL